MRIVKKKCAMTSMRNSEMKQSRQNNSTRRFIELKLKGIMCKTFRDVMGNIES